MEETILKLLHYLLDAFRNSPASLVLLVVVVLQHRVLEKKDELVKEMIDGQREDVERNARMLVLLEMLVNRQPSGSTGGGR